MTPSIITKLYVQFVENIAEMQLHFTGVDTNISFFRENPLKLCVCYSVTRDDKKNIAGAFFISDCNYHIVTPVHKTKIYQFLNREV